MKTKRFNAAITSFKLGDDPEAGYTLLTEAKKIAPGLPVIIYTGRVSWEHEAEAKRRGAFDETNSPVRLFDLIVSIIKGR
jgi:DNA-binding NtrC family response regulator